MPPRRTRGKPVPGAGRTRQAGLLLEVATKVAAAETLDDLLAYVVEVSVTGTAAERGTLFLNDHTTHELYSRIALGVGRRELRLLNDSGIAGHVFQTGQGLIVDDAYADPRFNPVIDRATGFTTRNIACAPIVTPSGDRIGVLEILNKREGSFSSKDLRLLESLGAQTAMTLRTAQVMERMLAARQEELKFLDSAGDLTSDLDLDTLLPKVVTEAARMLQADRATLFLNDEKKGELFSRVAMGDSVGEIRLPNTAGIAGAVFTSGQAINIPLRLRRSAVQSRASTSGPATSRARSSASRSSTRTARPSASRRCSTGAAGPSPSEDEERLKAFTAQLAISLENAKLFDDIQNIKNYNEGMLQSMSNGVVTLNEDGQIVTCNRAGERILQVVGRRDRAEACLGPVLGRQRLGDGAHLLRRKNA